MGQKPPHTSQIANFENIAYRDQLTVIAQINPNEAEKFKRITRKREAEKEFSHQNFAIDYAGKEGSLCSYCHNAIEHQIPRIRSIVHQSDSKYGKQILWTHMSCFAFNRELFNYPWDGKLMEGFNDLLPEDQVFISESLPYVSTEVSNNL
jgi:hypothetical protein